jgi:hypothetical protein
MNTNTELSKVGCNLKRYAETEAEFSARGVIDELFPYIYMAAKRMSTRAISRWLKDTHKIKLSPVTIAKALRESDEHWETFFEKIEPSARIFGDAHSVYMRDFLMEYELFAGLKSSRMNLTLSGEEGYREYERAVEIIERDWFQALDESTREECARYIPDEGKNAKSGK